MILTGFMRKNNLELLELSIINKVSLVHGSIFDDAHWNSGMFV